MYTEFYGLRTTPFDLTPDPFFFSPTPRHYEALASLWYGLKQRKGFVVVTGEVGTGKTLVLQCLLHALTREQAQFSYIFNPRLNTEEFFRYIAADFGISVPGTNSKGELLWGLNRWLIATHKAGTMAVVVVDEAHLLDWEVLEEIRLLTNLETTQHKLLQIVLSGQPELDTKLDSPELRQLKQRIAFRTTLLPLTIFETCDYIWARLHKAGVSSPNSLFPRPVCGFVHGWAGGIPRLVNSICDKALIYGFAKQAKTITTDIIDEIATEYDLSFASENAVDRLSVGPKAGLADGQRGRAGAVSRFPNTCRKG